jgi:polysaccharide biosynthesis transport protein
MYDEMGDFDEQSSSQKSLADYWAVAVDRRWTILLPLFVGWAAVWTVSWFLPSTYKSEALILVEEQKIPEQYVVPNVTESIQDRLQSMTEQILSRTRLQATIDRYNLYPTKRGLDNLLAQGDAVTQMRKDIKIDSVNASDHPGQLTAFKIEYTARSPELAQQINKELTSLFIAEDQKTQQQLSEGTTAFLESQLADAKAKLEEQEAKVRAFKAKHFGDLPSQMETNVSILTGLQNQLEGTQRDLDSARQQKLYLESLQQQYQAAQANLGTPDSSAPSIPGLTKELMDLQVELTDAETRLTDQHPDVIALKDKIAKTEKLKKALEAQLAANSQKAGAKGPDPAVSSTVQNGGTTPMMQTQSQLKAVNLQIENAEQRIKSLDQQIADYRSRLNMTPQTEQELADISRGYEESKANYNSLLQKQNQSQLATSLQEEQQGQQFRMLDPPSLPTKPAAPNRLLFSVGGLGAGAALGLGLALLLEMKNNVLRKEDDLEGLLPVRILAGIPHLAEPAEERRKARLLWLEVTAVSVMALLILAGNFYALRKG